MSEERFTAGMRLIEVLLVDDSPPDVVLTRKMLEQERVVNRIAVARDGVEALAYLRREAGYEDARRPDLILLDMNMPRMNGEELLAELQRDEGLRAIPAVVLTASEGDAEMYRGAKLAAAGYLTKPVTLAQLSELVQRLPGFGMGVVKLADE